MASELESVSDSQNVLDVIRIAVTEFLQDFRFFQPVLITLLKDLECD